MENKPRMTPKDFFLHIGVIVALYTVVISFLNLVFALVDSLYPPLDSYYYYGNSSPISWPMAVLIIVFPVLLLLSWLLKKDFALDSQKKELGLRKWLIYITLFVTGIVLVGDLITVVYKFLNGDLLTIGFILKALSVFIVAGAVFVYYILELKGKTTAKVNTNAFFASLIVVLALIIGSFTVLGSPRTQRLRKADMQRVQDLQSIQWQVLNYWQQKGKLPNDAKELQDPFSGFLLPLDPETYRMYEYEKTGTLTFKICAEFALAGSEIGAGYQTKELPRPYPNGIVEGDNWKHEVGLSCFDRTIDPERYPIFPK
jgi:hypothetical protein